MNRKQTAPKEARHILLNIPPDVYKAFRSNCVNEDTNMRAKLLKLMQSYNEEKNNKEAHRQIKRFLEMPKEELRLYPDGHREYIETYPEENKGG